MIRVYFSKKAANKLISLMDKNGVNCIHPECNNYSLEFERYEVERRWLFYSHRSSIKEVRDKNLLDTYIKYIKEELGGRVRIEFSE